MQKLLIIEHYRTYRAERLCIEEGHSTERNARVCRPVTPRRASKVYPEQGLRRSNLPEVLDASTMRILTDTGANGLL